MHLVCGWYASSLRSVRITYNYFPQTTDCKEPCSVNNLRTMYRVPDQVMYGNGPDLCMYADIRSTYVRTTYVCMYARVWETSWHQACHPTIQTQNQLHCTSMSVSASLLTSISKLKSMTLCFLLLFIVWPNAWSGGFVLHTYIRTYIMWTLSLLIYVSYNCPVSCALCDLGNVRRMSWVHVPV